MGAEDAFYLGMAKVAGWVGLFGLGFWIGWDARKRFSAKYQRREQEHDRADDGEQQ